jgi:hypothetical protein
MSLEQPGGMVLPCSWMSKVVCGFTTMRGKQTGRWILAVLLPFFLDKGQIAKKGLPIHLTHKLQKATFVMDPDDD